MTIYLSLKVASFNKSLKRAAKFSLVMAKRDLPAAFSHLKLGITLWQDIVNVGDTVVDCTCGNGEQENTTFLISY